MAVMCNVMDDMRIESARDAVEKDRIRNAMEMLKDGLSIEKVAQYTRLDVEHVRELFNTNQTCLRRQNNT